MNATLETLDGRVYQVDLDTPEKHKDYSLWAPHLRCQDDDLVLLAWGELHEAVTVRKLVSVVTLAASSSCWWKMKGTCLSEAEFRDRQRLVFIRDMATAGAIPP